MTLYERIRKGSVSQREFDEALSSIKTRYAEKRCHITVGILLERLNHIGLCDECKRKISKVDFENWH